MSVTSIEASGVRPGRAGRRWRAARLPLIVLAALAVFVWVLTLVRAPADTESYSARNPAPNGSQALARVLEAKGVTVHRVDTPAEALRYDGPNTTILVVHPTQLNDTELSDLNAARSDLVLTGQLYDGLAQLTDGALTSSGAYSEPGGINAECTEPEAERAGTVSRSETVVSFTEAPDQRVTTCFPSGDVDQPGWQYAVWRGEHDVRVIADPSSLQNGWRDDDGEQTGILLEGNAALALGALGRHPTLVWLVVDQFAELRDSQPSMWQLVPPWLGPATLVLLFAALLAAIWRGRSFGPVVREPLPVAVRGAETAYGRGRLYRSARSYGHAGAALRAGAADRH